jgi:hypothetical protein
MRPGIWIWPGVRPSLYISPAYIHTCTASESGHERIATDLTIRKAACGLHRYKINNYDKNSCWTAEVATLSLAPDQTLPAGCFCNTLWRRSFACLSKCCYYSLLVKHQQMQMRMHCVHREQEWPRTQHSKKTQPPAPMPTVRRPGMHFYEWILHVYFFISRVVNTFTVKWNLLLRIDFFCMYCIYMNLSNCLTSPSE